MTWYKSGDISKLIAVPKNNVLCFDVETTGIRPQTDEILQVAFVRGDGTTAVNEYLKPEHHQSWPEAQRKHGISPSMVRDAKNMSELAPTLTRLVQDAKLLVAYNMGFDVSFLERAGVKFPKCLRFDVMHKFAAVAHQPNVHGCGYRWQTLESCARHYACSFVPHSAIEDARATLECFYKMLGDDGSAYGSKSTVPYLKIVHRRN